MSATGHPIIIHQFAMLDSRPNTSFGHLS